MFDGINGTNSLLKKEGTKEKLMEEREAAGEKEDNTRSSA